MLCQWLQIMVVVVVCGGAGLAMCKYWRVPRLPYTYHGDGDSFQLSPSHNGQGSGYTGSQRHKSDSVRKEGSVQSHPQQMNDYEPDNEYHGHYATIQHELNRHANDVNYEHLVESRKSLKGDLGPHQNNLTHNNSLHSHEINPDHPGSNSIPANESFIGKEAKSPSHSDSHQTYKSSPHYSISNTVVNSPLSVKVSSGGKKEGHLGNQTFMTDMESKSVSKMDEKKKQNKGPPRAILLLTRWRSGSTFMGELLTTAVPETFYR